MAKQQEFLPCGRHGWHYVTDQLLILNSPYYYLVRKIKTCSNTTFRLEPMSPCPARGE
ncbi:MAG: hypothetical protein HFJ06_09215 [Lachnospiraceae bacterium]|nr:hypothetical protein [Lachnospiraceae bacterium]